MNSIALVLILGLVAASNAQTTTTGTIGFPTSITANNLTTITFPGGIFPSLDVLVKADTTVLLNIFQSSNFSSLFGGLPKGYGSLSLGSAIGYTVQFANGNALVSANLTTSTLDAAAQQLITAAGRAGALSFSASSNSFEDIPVNVSQNKVTVAVQQAATYLFTAVQTNAATPNIYGKIKTLLANATSTIAFANNYTTNFIVQVTAQANADLKVVFSTQNPAPRPAPASLVPIGAYWDITAAGTSVNAVLNYTFTQAQLNAAGAAASTLRFAFYNTASATWDVIPAGASVDTVAKVVSQATTHFSQWGVYSLAASNQTATDTAAQSSQQYTATSQPSNSATTNTGDAQGVVVCVFLFASCLLAVL
jgi:hypothetical protein